jgi:hypothetical protein
MNGLADQEDLRLRFDVLTKTKQPELHRYWTQRDRAANPRLFRVLSAGPRKEAGTGARSVELAQPAEEEVNASLDASRDFGLAGRRRHEVVARLALVERHAVDVNLLAGERGGTGQPDRVRRDASDERGPGAVGTGRRLRLGGRAAHRVHLPATILPQRVADGKP